MNLASIFGNPSDIARKRILKEAEILDQKYLIRGIENKAAATFTFDAWKETELLHKEGSAKEYLEYLQKGEKIYGRIGTFLDNSKFPTSDFPIDSDKRNEALAEYFNKQYERAYGLITQYFPQIKLISPMAKAERGILHVYLAFTEKPAYDSIIAEKATLMDNKQEHQQK